MTIHAIDLQGIDGRPLELTRFAGSAVLVVNVASFCGLTPQYAGLEALHQRYTDQGFSVLGVPCNQFGAQEPGGHDEIQAFCSTNYGITFPLAAKADVNGERRHPLFAALTAVADGEGRAGDVDWNFEKFLVSPQGDVVARFRSSVTPDAPEVVAAIEAALPVWKPTLGRDVQAGDVVRVRGLVLTVSRVEPHHMREGMLALVEDTPTRWLKRPVAPDAEVDVLVG